VTADPHIRKVGLLTGTFDPVHVAHVELARVAIKEARLDEVWLMVNPRLINSPVENKHKVSSFQHRMAMAKLAVSQEAQIEVYNGDLKAARHTMADFAKLIVEYPTTQFSFIVGSDVIARMDRWEDLVSVVRSTSFIVAERPSASIRDMDELRLRLGDIGKELKAQVLEFNGYTDVSSSAARLALAGSEQPQWLHPDVRDYILRNNLYAYH
jgi:nicotinate-nucleotide adenylyltransferase